MNQAHWIRGIVRLAVPLAIAVGLALPAQVADAAGITLGRFGGIYGHPNADGGLALYWNAARLTARPGAFVLLDATLVMRDASYDRTITEENPSFGLEGVEDWNTGRATTSTRALLPMMAFGGSHAVRNSRIGWALGGYPSYGGGAQWDKNLRAPAEYPGAVDGTQRWHAISSSMVILHATAALAWEIGDTGVSVGGSASYVDAHLETTRARNVNREEALVFDDGGIQEGRVWLRTNDSAFSGTLGIAWDRPKFLWSTQWRSGYTLRMSGVLRQAFATQTPSDVASHVDLTLPHVVVSAFTYRLPRVDLTLVLDFSRWSTLERTDLVSNADPPELLLATSRFARDTLSARGIVGWSVHPNWELTFTAGVDPSAIPERTNEPGLSDALKFPVGLGVSWDPEFPLRWQASYTEDIYTKVTVTNSVHEPSSNGTYRDARRFLTLSMEATW